MPHIHEKIDFTATAFLVHENTVLLRMHDKYKTWLGVGGHIELDEDPNQAVVREIKEEVGLYVTLDNKGSERPDYKVLVPPDFMNIHKIAGGPHQHMDLVYLIRSDSNDVVPSGSDQSNEWKWFTAKELDDPKYKIQELIVSYAKAALEKYPT